MASKKTFKDSLENPAELFISKPVEAPAETKEQETPATAPKGYRVNPLYIETKSKRLQLLVQPSLKAKLKEKAKREGTSVNDLVNSILYDALAEE